MAKYKVGDRVRVKSDLKNETQYGRDITTGDMISFAGKEVTIRTVTSAGSYKIEGNTWNWTDEMFEESIYKVGQELYSDDSVDYHKTVVEVTPTYVITKDSDDGSLNAYEINDDGGFSEDWSANTPLVEITLAEIAKLKGVDVNLIRVKD